MNNILSPQIPLYQAATPLNHHFMIATPPRLTCSQHFSGFSQKFPDVFPPQVPRSAPCARSVWPPSTPPSWAPAAPALPSAAPPAAPPPRCSRPRLRPPGRNGARRHGSRRRARGVPWEHRKNMAKTMEKTWIKWEILELKAGMVILMTGQSST